MIRKTSSLSIFLFVIILTISLAGCSSSKTPTIDQITQKVKQSSSDLSNMRVGDSAALKKLYNIDSTELDGFSLFTAPSNIKADEIAILKVKDANSISDIKDKIMKRVDKQSKSFSGYLPDEYYLIQHNILKVNGNYVIFAISKDAEKISSAFDETFK